MEDNEFLQILDDIDFTPSKVWNGDIAIEYSEEDEVAIESAIKAYGAINYKEDQDAWRSAYDKYTALRRAANDRAFKRHGIGPYEIVLEEGGGEGNGEHVELVVHFPEHDRYVCATATYMSHYGIDDWSDWGFVRPKQKTITVYE